MATVAPVTRIAEVRPVRVILNEFIDEYIDGADEIAADELIAEAEQRFTTDDEFAAAAARDILATLIPVLLRNRIGRRRDVLETARGGIKRARLEQTARERLAQVFESVDGRYRNLLTMRRPELRSVIADRKTQVAGELRWIKGLRAFEKALPDDTTPLASLPSQRLDEIWQEHFAHSEPGE